MDDPAWEEWGQTVAELRARYGALRLSTLEECMTMVLAAAAQIAHREDTHPCTVLHNIAIQTHLLWHHRWHEFIHEMLEADE